MSDEASRLNQAELSANPSDTKPTRVRIGIAAALTLMSCLLYLDRFAVGIASEYIREDLRMTQTQMSWFISAFFWSYALSQVPAGWLSDRFGQRLMLTVYILAWSAFTGLLGMAASVWLVLHLRLYMGAAQAGAFPVCGGLIRAWFPISRRGIASSIIALGGRAGGVLAPILTAWLIIFFASSQPVRDLNSELLDREQLCSDIMDAVVRTDSKGLLLRRFYDSLPKVEQADVAYASFLCKQREVQNSQLKLRVWTLSQGFSDIRATLFGTTQYVGPVAYYSGQMLGPNHPVNFSVHQSNMVRRLGEFCESVGMIDNEVAASLSLPPMGRTLLERRASGDTLTSDEVRLLNRLALEAASPKSIRKHAGLGWRPTLISYGLAGLVVALAFMWICRDTPKRHPWCNEAERRFIDDEASLAAKAAQPADAPFPFMAIITSLSLWGNSLMQFFTNIGWLFVVTWLPRYLDKVHGVPLAEQALMTAVPTAAGIIGMFFGGWWTDFSVRTAGLKWGRRLPVFSTRMLAAAGYGICLVLGMTCTPDPTTRWLPWAIVCGLSVMVMGCDLGIPAVWAYAQDVGGKYTGSILGWANMWGNIGAAVAPLIYNAVLGETPTVGQWNTMFIVCGVAFVLSGLCGLVLDATKPITAESK